MSGILGAVTRLAPTATLLATALAGCGSGGGSEPSPPGPDTVYVVPQFTEAVIPAIVPQIYDYDWSIEGTTDDRNGRWALAGDTVEVRLNSPLGGCGGGAIPSNRRTLECNVLYTQ